jgi:hypothetical protein
MLQRRGRFLPDDDQLALMVSFAGGGAPLLLLGLPVRHLLPSHLLGRWDVGGSSSSAPFRASCGLGLLCGEDVCMECRQRPGWLVVSAPDDVSGDRPGPRRVQQLQADPHLLCISEALVPGVGGAVLLKPWGDTGCPGGGGRGCPRGLSSKPSGARSTCLLYSGSRLFPFWLEARRRAAYTALFLLGAGCCPARQPPPSPWQRASCPAAPGWWRAAPPRPQ